ncbi:kynureninase [Rhodocytophaga aerolata]|uniref:Kynureninase n=1 Tax=Rhodocytophaga aerolata TaxID=455078 RepID=A0ABT8RDW1_9BACT|nr:kynureninase [Rhodocytophaga aerolata]MDO1450301.1 kynureninase [Rhodocytophaga aerolata]
MMFENTLAFARKLDAEDPLKNYREQFYIPQQNGKEVIYFCGNSLGLQPKSVRKLVEEELEKWQNLAVEGHFTGDNPWFTYHKQFKEPVARLVGALPHEVIVMNNLTTNLHLMLVSFYQPSGKRIKIITEKGAFPSDQYALESQVRYHGHNPDEVIIELAPREGECTLRTEDIISTIEQHSQELALVMMGGLNYYTGQVFDMQAITDAGHKAGAYVGFDLAHAAGNIMLDLHAWQVDFAVWCTYKYLNSSPGGVAGAFIHEKHAANTQLPRFAGWWGHREEERFQMKKGFIPIYGADGWQLANAPILLMAAHKAALAIFDEVGMEAVSRKSKKLTGYLEYMLKSNPVMEKRIQIITPENPAERGSQLSLLVKEGGKQLFEAISAAGVIADWREPNAIRVAPAPLYNSFEEVFRFHEILSGHLR